MVKILDDIFNLFFPETCVNCGSELEIHSNLLCFSCLSDFPLTQFSFAPGNRLELSFRGRIPVISATALLYFHKKGMVQKLIHQLKYHNRQHIGTYLGAWLGEEMISSGRFESIDMIVPVPLHPDKEKKRGYNQVTAFAESLSRKIGAPVAPDLLIKVSRSVTQTLKNREQRALNKYDEFELRDKRSLIDQHVLLVDDIITTGATLEGCFAPFQQIQGIKISLASMAFTV